MCISAIFVNCILFIFQITNIKLNYFFKLIILICLGIEGTAEKTAGTGSELEQYPGSGRKFIWKIKGYGSEG